jgi:uncharacterized protein
MRADSSETGFTDLEVMVSPRSGRNRYEVVENGLKCWLTAAPVDNQANTMLVEYLSDTLGLAKSKLAVVKGQTSKRKIVRIEGLAREQIIERLTPGERSR